MRILILRIRARFVLDGLTLKLGVLKHLGVFRVRNLGAHAKHELQGYVITGNVLLANVRVYARFFLGIWR